MSTNDTSSFHSIPFQANINHELKNLAAHNVFATDNFKAKVDPDVQWRIFRQLRVLFDDYPIIFKLYFKSYLAAVASWGHNSTPGKFMIDVMPARDTILADSTGKLLGGRLTLNPTTSRMLLNCAGKNADMFLTPASSQPGLPQYTPDSYLEFIVAHEVGHCIQSLFLLWETSKFKESPIETRQFIQRTLGAQHLDSRIGIRWQQEASAAATQSEEFFADFFAYVHCGEDVPESYKTVLDQVINRWFPDLTTPAEPIVNAQSTPAKEPKKAPEKEPNAAPPKAGPKPSAESRPKKGYAKHKQHKHKHKRKK